MGIGSLFIVNNKTESLCALKHWGPTVPHAAVLDKVFASHRESVKHNLYSDVLTTEGKQYCFHITRSEITYIATTESETEPLMVVEFLTRRGSQGVLHGRHRGCAPGAPRDVVPAFG